MIFNISDTPYVNLDVVKVVGARRIFLNWTVNDGNEPVKEYFIQVNNINNSRLISIFCCD